MTSVDFLLVEANFVARVSASTTTLPISKVVRSQILRESPCLQSRNLNLPPEVVDLVWKWKLESDVCYQCGVCRSVLLYRGTISRGILLPKVCYVCFYIINSIKFIRCLKCCFYFCKIKTFAWLDVARSGIAEPMHGVLCLCVSRIDSETGNFWFWHDLSPNLIAEQFLKVSEYIKLIFKMHDDYFWCRITENFPKWCHFCSTNNFQLRRHVWITSAFLFTIIYIIKSDQP